jgi:uncharacterized membrane protein
MFQEVHKIKICPKNGKTCFGNCSDNEGHMNCSGTEIIHQQAILPIHLQLKGAQWFKVTEVVEIFGIFDKVGNVPYRLVAGNTGQGKQHAVQKALTG